MRRLITALLLIGFLLLVAGVVTSAQQSGSGIFGRRDTANRVICYQVRPESDYLSCVYIPPDGTQVNVPQGTGGNT